MEDLRGPLIKELDRGPLGKLAYPDGGMVYDVALKVWDQLDIGLAKNHHVNCYHATLRANVLNMGCTTVLDHSCKFLVLLVRAFIRL